MQDKRLIALRYWMLGKNYHNALAALEFAMPFHSGTRKDGVTPEFEHQLIIASYIKTLNGILIHPEACLAAVFLHDTAEDADVGFPEIESLFGAQVCEAVRKLTKKHRGEKLDIDTYYESMVSCPIASIVKGADRMHNLQSMPGVFDRAKQISYCNETQNHILPMLKKARKTHTQQYDVYENIKLILENQIKLIDCVLESEENATITTSH
jgi:(p)ppGpp synthase/HD superfamily hydrolase